MSIKTAESFDSIWHRAAQRKGSSEQLEALLSAPLGHDRQLQITDDRWLSAFTCSIFQSGFVWRVIETKWPNFEKAFFGFDIEKMLLLNDQHIERLCTDSSIVRNRQKIVTVAANALMIHKLSQEHGSFSLFVSNWPKDDLVGLLLLLKKQGSRLGGNTAAYTLRRMGGDTFVLSRDVITLLVAQGIVDKPPSSQRDLKAVQLYFNQLREQSGRAYTQISQVMAYSVGENYL